MNKEDFGLENTTTIEKRGNLLFVQSCFIQHLCGTRRTVEKNYFFRPEDVVSVETKTETKHSEVGLNADYSVLIHLPNLYLTIPVKNYAEETEIVDMVYGDKWKELNDGK